MIDQSGLDARILEGVADALIYSDRSGTILRWNGASTALFGFSADEALGQNLDLIIPEHLRAAHWKGFEAAIASGTMKLAGRPTLTRAKKLVATKHESRLNDLLGQANREALIVMLSKIANDF